MMSRLQKTVFLIATFYGLSALIIAALGSHVFGVGTQHAQYQLYNNAVIYQLLHAILLVVLCFVRAPDLWVRASLFAFVGGVFLFCGGLYLLVFVGKTSLSVITPIGGSLIILGWLNLTISSFNNFFKK